MTRMNEYNINKQSVKHERMHVCRIWVKNKNNLSEKRSANTFAWNLIIFALLMFVAFTVKMCIFSLWLDNLRKNRWKNRLLVQKADWNQMKLPFRLMCYCFSSFIWFLKFLNAFNVWVMLFHSFSHQIQKNSNSTSS